MMRILIVCMALLCAACIGPQKQADWNKALAAEVKPPRAEVIATLSTNACEAATAPAYTRATLLTRTATVDLQTGRINRRDAMRKLTKAREALNLLDGACVGGVLQPYALGRALEVIEEIGK